MTTGGQINAGGGRGDNEANDVDGQPTQSGQEQVHVTGTDDLLDEIDGLLESNAEEFVKSYVQKGGQ